MSQGAGVTGSATDAAVRTLQQLQQQLVTALDGAGDGLNVTSPEELTQLVRSAGTALQSLAGSPISQQLSSAAEQVMAQSGVMAQNGGQLVSQLARSLTPVSEAAGQMLQGFRENLSQLVMPLLGGQ
jgi:alpha-D-ribose 1-methylphosphonate 5-triphosphate synthase subunit PhnI